MVSSSPSDSQPDSRFARVWTRTVAVHAGNAREQWTERTSVIVALGEDEHVGFGEAAPLPGWSHESAEEAEIELQVHARAFAIRGLGAAPQTATLKSVQFALESAWLDLAAQRAGQPAWALLAGAAPARLTCNALLAEHPSEWFEAALRMVARGAHSLKVKIGWPDLSVAAQLEALRALAAAVNVPIRLDANSTFDAAQAQHLREALRGDPRFEYVEDPVRDLRELTPAGLAFAADELFLRTPDAVRALQPSDGLAALVIKPTLYGSVRGLLSEAKAARARGVRTVIAHAFEGAIAYAALCHLAFALDDPDTCMGLAAHPALRQWPNAPTNDFTLERPTRAGLGLDADAILRWLDG